MSTPQPGTQIPEMDGIGYEGSSTNYAREDHVHPKDTAKADIISPNFIGTPTAPNPAVGVTTNQIATAKFVADSIAQNNNERLPSKQDKLVAGRNIILTQLPDGTVQIDGIDLTAMWTEVAKKQVQLNAGQNITMHEEEDGTVTISASGGSGGLEYFHETVTSLYGEYTLPTPKWSCLDGYYFDYAVEDHVGINDPSEHSLIAKSNSTPAIICAAITNSTGHFGSYYVGGIFFISKSPEGTAYQFTRNGTTYNGGYSVGDTYLDGNDANMVETYTYEGETWYIAVFGSLGLAGGGYPQDGNILHPSGIGGDYKNIHTVVGEIFSLVDPYNINKYYSGLHQGDNLAFFAGSTDSNGTDANIKIFTDGTTEGLVTEEELQDYAKIEDVPEIEANPSETPTDVLNSIGIDGTTYEIQGGGGGSNLILDAQIYSTEEKIVGVWTDGKPLYQKVFSFSPTITIDGSWNKFDNEAIYVPIKGTAIQTASQACYEVYIDVDPDGAYVKCISGTYTGIDAIILLYTKTTDSAGSGGYQAYGFSPIIYSEEEREVGVWTDNKPLYAKTITTGGSVPSGATLIYRQELSSKDCIYYTKDSDVAGSGEYNTLGIPNVHYDGSEKVIGTYFGETLYERTWDVNDISIGNSSATVITSAADFSDIKQPVNAVGHANATGEEGAFPLVIFKYSGNVYARSMESFVCSKLTIQYTKTT